MPTLPYPSVGNITTLTGMMNYANVVTDNLFAPLTLMSIYFIIFIFMARSKEYPYADVAMYAGFSTTILAIMMKVMGILPNDKIIFFAIVSFIIPMMVNLHSDR